MNFEEEGYFSNKKPLPLPVILQKREKFTEILPIPYESKIKKDLVTSITI